MRKRWNLFLIFVVAAGLAAVFVGMQIGEWSYYAENFGE